MCYDLVAERAYDVFLQKIVNGQFCAMGEKY